MDAKEILGLVMNSKYNSVDFIAIVDKELIKIDYYRTRCELAEKVIDRIAKNAHLDGLETYQKWRDFIDQNQHKDG